MLQITVFTRPSCVPCKFTKRKLDELAVEYRTVDLTKDPSAHEKVTDWGFSSAPVVDVDCGDGASWRWSGYAPTQLDRLASLVA